MFCVTLIISHTAYYTKDSFDKQIYTVHLSFAMMTYMYYDHHTILHFSHPHLLQISNMPDKVTWKDGHSISAVGVSDSCVWFLVIGGYATGTITRASSSIALVEMSEYI